MRKLFGLAFGLMFLAATAVTPALAQQRELAVPPTAGWKHAATGFILRPKLAGYQRTSLVDSGTAELDVTANFAAPDNSTSVTVYLFRPALMSVPVWFDRSETAILAREAYGSAQPVVERRAFAPPQAKVASGLRRIYAPSKPPYKSTGLAIMPMGDWLVAVRISSAEFDPATLETKLDEIIAALGWPQGVTEGPAAVPVEPCAKPLVFAKRARLQKPSMADALIGAALAGVVSKQDGAGKPITEKPVVYCRDLATKIEFGIYRDAADADADSYVIALNDSGRVIRVEPSLSGLVSGTKGYSLSFADLSGTSIFPSFDKLASPEQAFEVVRGSAPMSSTSATATGHNITINAGGN